MIITDFIGGDWKKDLGNKEQFEKREREGEPDIDGMAQDSREWADEHGAVCTEQGWEV